MVLSQILQELVHAGLRASEPSLVPVCELFRSPQHGFSAPVIESAWRQAATGARHVDQAVIVLNQPDAVEDSHISYHCHWRLSVRVSSDSDATSFVGSSHEVGSNCIACAEARGLREDVPCWFSEEGHYERQYVPLLDVEVGPALQRVVQRRSDSHKHEVDEARSAYVRPIVDQQGAEASPASRVARDSVPVEPIVERPLQR